MRCALIVSLLLASSAAMATPCETINHTLTDDRKTRLGPVVAAALNTKWAKVVESLQVAEWYILLVETRSSDPAFMFFHGDPVDHTMVTLWSGGAMIGEGPKIKRWVLDHAPGIPATLAACFAYRVTPHGNE